MDIIYQNPFRILGMPITATDRQIAKQIGDMAIYADMGKIIEYDSDSFFSVKPIRTSESIQEAKQKIDQPGNKLFYALFWFWENSDNIVDEMAFEELKNGNVEKAIEFWERETGKGITSQNKSNHKNLYVLRMGLSAQNGTLDKNQFLESLSLSGEFLTNDRFDEFTKLVLDARHSVNLIEITNNYINEIISIVKPYIVVRKSDKKITHKELLHYFETYPESVQNNILEKFTGKHIFNIERQIDKSEQNRKDDVSHANKTGFELYKSTQEDIKQLKAVLSKSDLKYQLVADKLAEELIGCSIAYFNEFYDSETDPGDDALKLLKYGKKIAVGEKIKNRIKENQPIIQEYVNNRPKRIKLKPVQGEFNFIYDKLRALQTETDFLQFPNIAKRFLEVCEPKLNIIKNKLGKTDNDFLKLSDIVAGNAMGLCFELLSRIANDAEEEYTNSNNEKRNLFRRAVLLIKPIFDLIGKMELSHSKRKEYTDFCENIGFSFTTVTPYPRISVIPSSSSSSSKDGCYIATMVYGSYNAPEVLILRNFRDDVLTKNKLGEIFIKIYYIYSPKFVELTNNIKIVHKLFKMLLGGIIKLIEVSK